MTGKDTYILHMFLRCDDHITKAVNLPRTSASTGDVHDNLDSSRQSEPDIGVVTCSEHISVWRVETNLSSSSAMVSGKNSPIGFVCE